jgi:hypothetical protein
MGVQQFYNTTWLALHACQGSWEFSKLHFITDDLLFFMEKFGLCVEKGVMLICGGGNGTYDFKFSSVLCCSVLFCSPIFISFQEKKAGTGNC